MITSALSVRRGLASLIALVLAVIILLAGIWLGGHPASLPSPLRGSFFESRGLVLVNQALNVLTTRYYRPVNRSSLLAGALSGMVASLDDPYSDYLDAQAYRKRGREPPQPPGGIGINTAAEPRGLRVTNVLEGSPAAAAGLRSGDLIIKVGSVSLADRAESGPELIRGPVDTTVELAFLRDDVQHVISLKRASVVPPVASWQIVTYHDLRIGHLRFTRFTEGSGDKLRTELRAALDAGAQGLILDLRGNGGGLVSEAINVASIFIPHGEIMSSEERGGRRRVYTARDDAIAPRIPLVVLVDHGTASAAEIVTGALKDRGRAEVVGTETYGMGVFQVAERLINGGALDITVGRYFTPDGQNPGGGVARQEPGIVPNVYALNDPETPPDEALAVAERTVGAETTREPSYAGTRGEAPGHGGPGLGPHRFWFVPAAGPARDGCTCGASV